MVASCYHEYSISIHALLAESDHPGHLERTCEDHFYPRSPCGERLQRQIEFERYSDISIHALLAESDRSNSTKLPTGGHFYPRSPCGERPGLGVGLYLATEISIHALLAESDWIRYGSH